MMNLTTRASRLALAPVVWIPALLLLLGALAAAFVFWGDDGSGHQEHADETIVLGDAGSLRQPVHWHADFALFIRGEQFDFNQPGFVSKEGEEHDPWVHIHEPRYTVVHVHREQTTWDEFFTSIGFKLTDSSITLPSGETYKNSDSEQLKFFVNGIRIDALQFHEIHDLSQVLITFGPESDEEVLATQWPAISDEACIPSGLCADRGAPEDEPCGKGSGTCTN